MNKLMEFLAAKQVYQQKLSEAIKDSPQLPLAPQNEKTIRGVTSPSESEVGSIPASSSNLGKLLAD
jgi:hypothetical protein